MITHCSKCGKRYNLFDRLAQPSMCASCDAIENPDPFKEMAREFPFDVKLQSGGTFDGTMKQNVARRGIRLMLVGVLLASIGIAFTFFIFRFGGGADVALIVGIWVMGGVQLLRGSYMFFVSSRNMPNHSPDPTLASGTSRAGHEPRHP